MLCATYLEVALHSYQSFWLCALSVLTSEAHSVKCVACEMEGIPHFNHHRRGKFQTDPDITSTVKAP